MLLLPVFTAARPAFLGASGAHQSLCVQQEATPRWSHLPGGPGSHATSPPGRSWCLKPNCLQDRDTHAMERERFPPPTPALAGAGGGVPRAAPGRRCAALRAAGSVLLLLLGCDCGDAVLRAEAFHEEVDDGAVEVLPEGGAVEVMALVRVDLRGRRAQVGGPAPPPGGCTHGPGRAPGTSESHPRDELPGAPRGTARASPPGAPRRP